MAAKAMRRGRSSIVAMISALTGLLLTVPANARNRGAPPAVKQVASDLYFFFDYSGSNLVFMVTDAGVLVIDTRQHPKAGEDLLADIRKVTDKPIKWVINSHFHGDHHFGNAPFRAAGATFVAMDFDRIRPAHGDVADRATSRS